MSEYYITRKGYEKLYLEYLNIDKEIIEANKMMGESVKRDNDLRENPEFMALRVKTMYELPSRKKELWDKYNEAIIIEETEEYRNFDGNTVIKGCKVKLDLGDEICEYQIMGSSEGDLDNDILSCDSPMAQVLLGKRLGETVVMNEMKIRIMEIEKI